MEAFEKAQKRLEHAGYHIMSDDYIIAISSIDIKIIKLVYFISPKDVKDFKKLEVPFKYSKDAPFQCSKEIWLKTKKNEFLITDVEKVTPKKINEWNREHSKFSGTQPKLSRGHIDRKSGFVYFMQIPKTKMVKIGQTINLRRRINEYRTFAPSIKVLGVLPTRNPHEMESDLHQKFRKYHIEGEWFQNSDEIQQYIQKKCISFKKALSIYKY